ncbi:MAG: 4-hydroxythreonine-4-phosphate dehydrogenase PdxA [Ignavibacteriaceae bacterium]|nr:4-hydroxythreonine-4-phosphate dehydrogenase PdxA [Ignavibacteriaceae bacterium]
MRFAVSCGDIGGIGPEIIIKSVQRFYHLNKRFSYILNLPYDIFVEEYRTAGADFPYYVVRELEGLKLPFHPVIILDLPAGKIEKNRFGKDSRAGGDISYMSILRSFEQCRKGICDAIVTAPISKTSMKLAGLKYHGHTELLAKLDKARFHSMFFLSDNFVANLFTIHIPVNQISTKITKPELRKFFLHSLATLKNDFLIRKPRVAVLGLNPHAGENGLIGKEEKNVLSPVIEEFGTYMYGPFVPDAFFANSLYNEFDLVTGMYHDQVLIPFKMLNFNSGVNYTSGLSVIRTSPDHGTAFDIAGKNCADPSSMMSAFLWAEKVSKSRKKSFAAS